MANDVEFDLKLAIKDYNKSLQKANQNMDKFSGQFEKSTNKMKSAWSSFAGNLAANAVTALASGMGAFAIGTIDAAKSLESMSTELGVLLGSTKAAKNQLKELQDFAASTPFQLPGLVDATKQLIQAGVAQEDMIDTLRGIGDIAAVTGKRIEDLAVPFARMKARTTVTIEEIQKFDDAGAGLINTLAEMNNVTVSEMRKDISLSKIGFEQFEAAIDKVTSKGGTFADGMIKKSKTLSGVLSTLNDNIFNLQGSIGSELLPIIKEFAISTITAIKAIQTPLVDTIRLFSTLAKWISGVESTKLELLERDLKIRKNLLKINEKTLYGDVLRKEIALLEVKIKTLNKVEAVQQPKNSDNNDIKTAQANEIFDKKLHEENKAIIEEEGRIQRAEANLVASEMSVEKRNEENEKILADKAALEERKLQALIKANNNKEKLEIDTKKRNILNEKNTTNEELLAIKNKNKAKAALNKQEINHEKAKNDNLKDIKKKELSDQQSFFTNAISLSNSSNKTLAAIGKAAALVQLSIKTPAAIANSFAFGTATGGPILGGIFAGIAGVAMAAQAANIAGVNFAQGGIVGGTSFTGDNVGINVNSSEMILNKGQQSTLFNLANNGGGNSGGMIEAIEALGNRIAQMEIVLVADDNEIARSTSRGVESGIVIGRS